MIDDRQIGIERDEMDYVSRWILSLAIGMIVLGTVFAVLDLYDLLPPLPAAAVAHADSTMKTASGGLHGS